MAIKDSIVSRPKQKRSGHHHKTSSHQVVVPRKSGQVRSVKETEGRYVTLPPGPANFIVRTPYPLAPSKEDETSE